MANNNNTKNLNVPTLRFPEFKGEWKEAPLTKYLEFKNGLNTDSKKFGKGVKFISIMDILNNQYITYDNIIGLVNVDIEIQKRYEVNYGDILFQRSSETIEDIGRANVYLDNKPAIFGGFVIRGKKIGNYYPEFFKYLLSSPTARKKVIVKGAGSQHYNIGQEGLSSILLHFPPLQEQNKIAQFLCLLDHRIATQNKIIEKYESLIKGIGNKLFSLKMRFKTNDGNDFPSWKTKSFENIGKTFSGLSGKAKEDFGIGKPYIQYKQVFDSPQIQIQNCGLVNVSDSENQNNVKYGDVFFTVSSETPDEIGMSSVLLDEVDEMYLNSFCFGYRLSSFEVLSPLYASYFFRDSSFRNKVVKIARGSTRYNISKSELIKLEISLPSIEEQARIASFLSAVDEKIKNEKEILNLYLIQKSYLLRQMFI